MAKSSSSKSRAVAVRYDSAADEAPKVTAKGTGRLAMEMIEMARQHGIPIHKEPNLVQILSMLELDQEIPPQVYHAVAEILSFIYRANNRGFQPLTGVET